MPYTAEPDLAAATRGEVSEPVRRDLVRAVILAVSLAVIGALAGLVWSAWSPRGPRAIVLRPGTYIPDETEAFVAGDGRYLVIAAALGIVTALVLWFRRERRGVPILLGLIVGGVGGSLLMELVGHLTGGGDGTGSALKGTSERYSTQLPLSLHAQGLLLVWPAVSALLYGLLVAFAVHDDLGRPDPVRDALVARNAAGNLQGPGPSVGPGAHPQDGGGHGDAPRPLQQGDLPPQQPGEPDQPF